MRFLVKVLLTIFEVLAEKSGELVAREDKVKAEKTKERERARKCFFLTNIFENYIVENFNLNFENLYRNIICEI